MENDSLFRATGLTLLGLLAGALVVVIAQTNDQKRLTGFDPQRSLTATCGPGSAAFYTNRERLAVYMERANGRVTAEPVWRGGEIVSLRCDAASGHAVIGTDKGERRVYVAQARGNPRELALMP